MGSTYADGIYVVAATNGRITEYWAAATEREVAVEAVQLLLGPEWTATLTERRLTTDKAEALKMRPNSVRHLGEIP